MIERIVTTIKNALRTTLAFAEDADYLWNKFYDEASVDFAQASAESFMRTYPIMQKPPRAVAFPNTAPNDIILHVSESSPMYYMAAAAMAEHIISHNTLYVAVPDPSDDLISKLLDLSVPPQSFFEFVKLIPAMASVASSSLKDTSLAPVAEIAFIDAAQRMTSLDIFRAAEAYVMTKVTKYYAPYDEAIGDLLDFLTGLLKPFNRSLTVTYFRSRYVNVSVVLMHIKIS